MIEINLLPKDLKKKKEPLFKMPELSVKFIPIGIGLISFLVLVQLILGLVVSAKSKTLARLDKEWERILPDKLQLDGLKNEIDEIQRKVNVIDELVVKRFLWSRKLNQLSDSMIPGIWLTKLSLEREGYLNLEGCASSTYGDETAVIGRFIKSLKENEGFFTDFSNIELDQIQRKAIKDIEVMRFKISCYFKGTGPAEKGGRSGPEEFRKMDRGYGLPPELGELER